MAVQFTYVPIATQTLGSATASITLSSIPSTYQDLVLISNFALSGTGDATRIQVGNGSIDTSTNYSSTWLYGTGSTAGSGRESSATSTRFAGAAVGPSTDFSTGIISFQNYANTSIYKTWIDRYSGVTSSEVMTTVGLWRSTSAINTVKLFNISSSNFLVGSTFTLYGIQSA
jgi:hypothetical protein